MTDSNATELKGCPFCGKKQAIHKEFGSWILNTTSHDRKCIMRKLLAFGMSGGLVFNTEAEAIAAWNTRTPEQAVAATLGAGECEWQMAVGEGFCEGHVWRNDDGEREQEPFGVASHILSCGHTVLMKNDRGDNTPIPNFCSYCGKAVNR